MIICVLLDSLEAISIYGVFAFTLPDPNLSPFSYMITCTHPLNVNGVGYLMHSLGHLFHLFGADFISIGSNFKSSHHLGSDYNSQHLSVLLTHHWISIVLNGPSFHPVVVPYPSGHISLLPKKKIPPDISI